MCAADAATRQSGVGVEKKKRGVVELGTQLLTNVARLCAAILSGRYRALRHVLPPSGRRRQRVLVLGGVLAPLLITMLSCASVLWLVPRSGVGVPQMELDARMKMARLGSSDVVRRSLDNKMAVQSVMQVLADAFYVPMALSTHFHDVDKYELLTRLQGKSSEKGKRLLLLHVVGSNNTGRLAAIASSLSYARLMQRILVVLWDTGRGGDGGSGNEPPLELQESAEVVDVFFVLVHELKLEVNEKDFNHLHVNYWSEASGLQNYFDVVAAHRERHIFLRTANSMSGKYVQHASGVELLSSLFVPGSTLMQTFKDFVGPWTFPDLSEQAVSDQLHRLYSVPRVFLAGMTDVNRRRLLHHLDLSSSKRIFFLHAQFGLGNRMRALGSAMAVAKVTGRVLVLIWVPDVHLNCEFNDLFVNDLIVMSKFSMEWPPSAIHSNDRALTTIDFYNFMRHEGNKQVHDPQSVYVDPRTGRHVYAKTAYVVKSRFTPRIISYTSAYWNTMRETLVPTADIMEVVEKPDLKHIRTMLGVHIRSRRIENDIKGVGQEFYGKGSKTTDFWRSRTSYKTFADKISTLKSSYKYFVAADTPSTVLMLRERFGAHRIFSISHEANCISRSVECAKLALADILLLSRTRVLLGSHWSSFSEAAVRMSGRIKVHFAGVHFGSPKSATIP